MLHIYIYIYIYDISSLRVNTCIKGEQRHLVAAIITNNSYWQSEGSSDEHTETFPVRVDIEPLPSRKRSRLAADEVSTSVYDFFRGET